MAVDTQLEKIIQAVIMELQGQGLHLPPSGATLPGASGAGASTATELAGTPRIPGAGEAGRSPSVAPDVEGEPLPEPITRTLVPQPVDPDFLQDLCSCTPARLGVGRAGTRPKTETLLKFRADHAAAVDAVFTEISDEYLKSFGLFTVITQAGDKDTFLTRPDLGRKLSPEGAELIKSKCRPNPQIQVVVADGLSSKAVEANLKDLLPALDQSLQHEGLSTGTPFLVRHGRVAIMDDIGEILQPEALILLIGERPGLVTAESLSAYLCYRPNARTIESDRTVISNIHRGGTPPLEAGAYLGTVVRKMITARASGVKLAALGA